MMVYMLGREIKTALHRPSIYHGTEPSFFSYLTPGSLVQYHAHDFSGHAGNGLFVEHNDFNIGGSNVTSKAVGRLGNRPLAFWF